MSDNTFLLANIYISSTGSPVFDVKSFSKTKPDTISTQESIASGFDISFWSAVVKIYSFQTYDEWIRMKTCDPKNFPSP